ncbi:hypothetical protein [Oricola sp.]|uniref:hypothetical protein n=1 Tax=Oricola sp. TaxID=1979950 RepID=UPI003519525F
MTKMLYGGATVPFDTGRADPNTNIDIRQLSRSALVDRFGLDLENASILLGPVARKFHGLSGCNERIGMRTFLECYDPDARAGLVDLIEKLAGEGRSFHFTARLSSPAGAFVHGFLAPASAGNGDGGWSGMLVMSRQEAAVPIIGAVN